MPGSWRILLYRGRVLSWAEVLLPAGRVHVRGHRRRYLRTFRLAGSVRVHDRAVLARIEVPGGAGGDAAPRGVLVRLDTPLAAFVHPVAWRWLRGEAVTERELPAASRAACEQAWIAAGLT